MRKEIITWVKGCLDCIRLQHNTQVSRQLVHSWPLLTPFAIISADIWSPGETTSNTGAKCILNCICNMSQFVVAVVVQHVNASELAREFMAVLLMFGLCLAMVVDDASLFKGIFVLMAKSLAIRTHLAAKRNHKAIGVERVRRFLNHSETIIGSARQTNKCFLEASMIFAYAWNSMPVDGTYIIRSIPTIGRPLRFPMNITLSSLPVPIDDAGKSTVSYIRQINKDARLASELVMCLTEERREHHRERVNQNRNIIVYKVNDMVMVRVQVQSDKAAGVVGKLSIEYRCPFRVVEDHGNGSYSVQ